SSEVLSTVGAGGFFRFSGTSPLYLAHPVRLRTDLGGLRVIRWLIMVMEHVAAVLFFSGPLSYVGLWMAVDPAGCATLSQWCAGVIRSIVRSLAGIPAPSVESERSEIHRRTRRALRCA